MINPESVTEVWLLKKKRKSNSTLGLFRGPSQYSRKGIWNMYEFIDTLLCPSFITFILHKQNFKDFASQLQFSVHIELSHIIFFSKID